MSEQRKSRFTGTAAVVALAAAGLVVLGLGGWAVLSVLRAPGPAGGPPRAGAPAPRTLQEVLESARALMDQDKPAQAEAILSVASARFPGSQQIRLLLGECLLQQERFDEALEEYEQGILIGPDHPEYRHVVGTIASRLNRLDEAEMHYLKAQSMDGSNPKFPLFLAQVQRKLGKNDEARVNLVIAARLDPSLAIAWASLAGLALEENRLSVALGYIERARALEPARAEWRIIHAKALRREGRAEEALALLTEIPERERIDHPDVLLEQGLCLGMLGRPGEAAELYARAVGAAPENAEFCYQAALWFERAGQNRRAAIYAQHAAVLGHDGARALLARVDE